MQRPESSVSSFVVQPNSLMKTLKNPVHPCCHPVIDRGVASKGTVPFIEKGGWDIMPGQEKADYGVSRACADGVGLLIKS